MNTNNSRVVTREKRGLRKKERVYWIKYIVTKGDLNLGNEHTMQCTYDVL